MPKLLNESERNIYQMLNLPPRQLNWLQQKIVKYIEATPSTVSESQGSKVVFNLAYDLIHGFAMPEHEANALMELYNRKCASPWPVAEIAHQVHDAAQRHCEQGYAYLRYPNFTHFHFGDQADLEQLSNSLGFSIPALEWATERGALMFGPLFGISCYGVCDRSANVLEVYPLDGESLPASENLPVRESHCMRHSRKSWPLGVLEVENLPIIALCVGGPDYLCLHQRILEEGVAGEVAPVCMLSDKVLIPPELLQSFAGKRVRIYPHNNPAAEADLLRWFRQLSSVGARVDFLKLNTFGSYGEVINLCDYQELVVPYRNHGRILPRANED